MSNPEEEYNSFKQAVEESALVGIIAYGCFLGSTVLASGLFGIPRFIVTPIDYNGFMWIDKIKVDKFDIGVLLRWPLKIILFIFATIVGSIGYFGLSVKYAWKGIESLKEFNTKEDWYYQRALSLLSMVVFATWFILLYRNIIKYNVVQDVVDDKSIVNTPTRPTSFIVPTEESPPPINVSS